MNEGPGRVADIELVGGLRPSRRDYWFSVIVNLVGLIYFAAISIVLSLFLVGIILPIDYTILLTQLFYFVSFSPLYYGAMIAGRMRRTWKRKARIGRLGDFMAIDATAGIVIMSIIVGAVLVFEMMLLEVLALAEGMPTYQQLIGMLFEVTLLNIVLFGLGCLFHIPRIAGIYQTFKTYKRTKLRHSVRRLLEIQPHAVLSGVILSVPPFSAVGQFFLFLMLSMDVDKRYGGLPGALTFIAGIIFATVYYFIASAHSILGFTLPLIIFGVLNLLFIKKELMHIR